MAKNTKNIDALIIGAGPCGLFQVFELGLLGIHSVLIDSLPNIGGQCSELYPDKPIYDIPGIPVCSGQELVDNLMEQIKPFNPDIFIGEEVISVKKTGDTYLVKTSLDQTFNTKTIFIAGGVGSFQPKKIKLKDIEKFDGQWLHYKVNDKSDFLNKDIIILGGGDSALDWAIEFSSNTELLGPKGSVTLIHRRNEWRGAIASVNKVKELENNQKIKIIENAILRGYEVNAKKLKNITLSIDGNEEIINGNQLIVFFGLSPKLGPIAEWGLEISKKSIDVNTETYETNLSGIFAIGDIANYPGKKKLILSGFHESALAAFAAKAIIEPGKKVHLQYTTTSPKLQQRLGISTK
ncbi:MAG: NAD(P)/FAD-dependent oxidoreductase [Gammaproteobacteria bacterium]|jgi:thioredoxin reductase (NADPH)|nr:NAD(P)/FAD-dependent oxidoreductase [Gammaproteobacteria bacterium]